MELTKHRLFTLIWITSLTFLGGATNISAIMLVETTITWDVSPEKKLITTGVDSDQLAAAIVATEKMLNLVIK